MITNAAVVLLVVPALLCLFCALHLVTLLIAALIGRNGTRVSVEGDTRVRVAVVIPAHNEEDLVGRTIESVKCCEYPPDLREIVVIADNCADLTAKIACKCGATVLERNNEHLRGKGYALSFFIEEYLACKKDVDAVVIIDSDTIVTSNLLHVVSNHICGGVEAGQVNHEVSNPDDGWRPAMQYISYALKNNVRALGRNALRCSGGLFGNGMFFTRNLLVNEGWPANSIVEDVEFGLRLALKGINVHYVPEAAALSLMPTSAAAGQTQKERWESGQIVMAKIFLPHLVRIMFRKPSMNILFWILELATPPLVPLFGFTLMLFLVSCSMGILGPSNLTAVLLLASSSSILLLTIYATGGLIVSHAPWCVWRSLVAMPLYFIWKLGLYFNFAFKGGPKEWVRTSRK